MKYYAVKIGKKTGIFKTWDECKEQVNGFSGAKYKSFKYLKDAERFLGNKKRKRVDENENELPNKKRIKKQNHLKKKSKLSNKKRIEIYTDGSFVNNRMGIGVVIKISEEVFQEKKSNNIAELLAIERAVDLFDDCCIYTDSEYSINVLTGTYTAKKNTEIVKRIKNKMKSKKITLIKVKAHAGCTENELADELAGELLK